MKLKIPNILTIGRIIIVPIFVVTFFLPGFFGDLIPFFLFVIASFTDYLDGLLARIFKEESKLGELLDPIADKILVSAALILLVMNGTIKNYEVIAAIIILTREILISGLREFLAKVSVDVPVSGLAKLKTFLQMISISILLTGESGTDIELVIKRHIGRADELVETFKLIREVSRAPALQCFVRQTRISFLARFAPT